MWIDTHCHLDAGEFNNEQAQIAQAAAHVQVSWIVLPAVDPHNFDAVAKLAHQQSNCVYAPGIHPLYVAPISAADLQFLRARVAAAIDDPRMVAIGEIGLDFFVPEMQQPELRAQQEYVFNEQLKIARDFDLPVLLHVRRSQDTILKYLRRYPTVKGIAHAFNGSFQQAEQFIELGFRLGVGGAMTFARALQIQRLARELPLDALVLETDAPDIAPAWLHGQRNTPEQIPRIGEKLAALRDVPVELIAQQTFANACASLPRLRRLAQASMLPTSTD